MSIEEQYGGWSNLLIAKAREYEAMAFRASLNARRIQGEIGFINSSLSPIQKLHTPRTWESKAAGYSRRRLNEFHTFYISQLVAKLEFLANKLHTYSVVWGRQAEQFYAQAHAQQKIQSEMF